MFFKSTTRKRESLTLVLLALVFGTEESTVWKLWLRPNDLLLSVCYYICLCVSLRIFCVISVTNNRYSMLDENLVSWDLHALF